MSRNGEKSASGVPFAENTRTCAGGPASDPTTMYCDPDATDTDGVLDGDVVTTVGAASVTVGTSAGAAAFPVGSGAVTTRLFSASCVSGTVRLKVVAPPASCWVATGVPGASAAPLLFASRNTFTRLFASAVPVMAKLLASRVVGLAGLVTTGVAGAV